MEDFDSSSLLYEDETFPEHGHFNSSGTVVKICILSFIAFFGTIGNVLVIVTICKDRKLRIPGNYFIINLTVSDIIITAFSIPTIISNLIRELTVENHEEYVKSVNQTGFCQTTAYLKVIALHVSWYSLAFTALNRYYSVCRMNEYATYFTKKRLLITVFLVWLWVILINIPIMVGWAIPNGEELPENSTEGYYFSYPRHGPPVLYDSSAHDCVLGVNQQGGYTYANGFFVLSIPLISIVFCYTLVYMEIVQSRRSMKSALNAKQLRRRYRKERKLSIMLAIVVLVFIICWTPVIVYDYTASIDNDRAEEDTARLIFSWLALANSAMNPGLYAILSKAFRVGYKRALLSLLSRLACGRCRERVEQSVVDLSSSSTSRSGSTTVRKYLPKMIFPTRRTPRSSQDFSVITNGRSTDRSGAVTPLEVRYLHNEKKLETEKVKTTGLTVPKERHYVDRRTKISHVSNSETASDSDNSKTGEERNSETSNQSEKKFVALLDQLDSSKDAFTPEGIYLGDNLKKSVMTELSLRRADNGDSTLPAISTMEESETIEKEE